MLDINLFRTNPELIKKSEQRRGKDVSNVDLVIDLDNSWRDTSKEEQELRATKNKVTQDVQVALKSKNKKLAEQKIAEVKKITEEINALTIKSEELLKKRDEARYKIGNILAKDVPDGGEENAVTIRYFGKAKVAKEDLKHFLNLTKGKMEYEEIDKRPLSHVDLGEQKDLFDTNTAGEIAGARFYFLKNDLVLLHMAILQFAIKKMTGFGYTPMLTPFMLNYESIHATAELGDFKDALYKIEGEDLYLIATSEETLVSYYKDKLIEKEKLPIKMVGISSCFRKEAGAHGKDQKGIFRVHQFDKVEQVVISEASEQKSHEYHEEMIKNAESILQELGLPYRVINIGSKDMNDNAAKKYDIEIWMPAQGSFREIASGSVLYDYQARKTNIKYLDKDEKIVAHTLNCTALPSPRILVAILENNQTKKGILVPNVLQKILGKKVI